MTDIVLLAHAAVVRPVQGALYAVQRNPQARAVGGLDDAAQVTQQGFDVPPVDIATERVREDSIQNVLVFMTHGFAYYTVMSDSRANPSCGLRGAPDLEGVTQVALNPEPSPADYRTAMQLADAEAQARLGDYMLLSWYDRDRDFESPQHASECHLNSAVPGYVDYGVHHGATLMVDIEGGRFVFFYLPVEL